MSASWPWSELGLDGKTDLRSVKRAYAQKLKTIDRNDADVFQALRDAFEAAKHRAKSAQTSVKPSMWQVAAGDANIQYDPDENGPFFGQDMGREAILAKLPEEAHEDKHQAPLAVDPTPPKPDTEREEEAAPPKAKPPTPWGKPEDTALDDEDAEDAFFRELTATYDTGVWKLAPLRQILARDLAMDRYIRDQAEYLLFERLRQSVVDEERTISKGVAEIMEQHFGWASDGVRFNKKFGWHEGYEFVAYDVAQAVRDRSITPPRETKIPMHGKPARVIMCILLYMGGLFVLWSDGFTEETYFFAAVIAAITFGVMWCVAVFTYVFLARISDFVRAISSIDRLAERVWSALIHRFELVARYDTAMRSPGPRTTVFFTFGFLATMALLCAWGVSRL